MPEVLISGTCIRARHSTGAPQTCRSNAAGQGGLVHLTGRGCSSHALVQRTARFHGRYPQAHLWLLCRAHTESNSAAGANSRPMATESQRYLRQATNHAKASGMPEEPARAAGLGVLKVRVQVRGQALVLAAQQQAAQPPFQQRRTAKTEAAHCSTSHSARPQQPAPAAPLPPTPSGLCACRQTGHG